MDIVLRHITKCYGEKTVLSDFNQVFEAGKRYAIAAPSGRGKTTLLRLILGLEEPRSGTITGVPEAVAAVFQEDRLCSRLTVLGNLRMALGRRVSDETILDTLRDLGIGDAALTKASQLSGGMARRAAIARAILKNPELLVLDEPFTGLDGDTTLRCAETIVSRCPHATILLVTHHMADAQRLGIQETVVLP